MELLDRSITDKMVAQAALQPGVGMVVRDVLRQGRDVVQLRWHCLDDPKPRPYADMRRSFGDAVVVGYVDSGSKRLHINPADKAQLLPGSRVLALTRQGARLAAVAAAVAERACRWLRLDPSVCGATTGVCMRRWAAHCSTPGAAPQLGRRLVWQQRMLRLATCSSDLPLRAATAQAFPDRVSRGRRGMRQQPSRPSSGKPSSPRLLLGPARLSWLAGTQTRCLTSSLQWPPLLRLTRR